MNLGEQIKDWRQKRGMSQVQLASLVNISTDMLWKLESGKRQPSRKTLDGICQALDLTYDKITLKCKSSL